MGHTFLRACQYEDDVFLALLQALHMVKQPLELMTPKVLLGMARYYLRRDLALARRWISRVCPSAE